MVKMKRTLINYLGILGIISLISYTLAVIFSPLGYKIVKLWQKDEIGKDYFLLRGKHE